MIKIKPNFVYDEKEKKEKLYTLEEVIKETKERLKKWPLPIILKNIIYFFTTSAKKDLKKLDAKDALNIENKIAQLTTTNANLDIKKLVNYNPPTYRLRVGNYRVLYEIHEQTVIILVIAVKHRKEAYN